MGFGKIIMGVGLLTLTGVGTGECADGPNFQKEIRPVLEAHCFKCHNATKQKGDVDLASITTDSLAAHRYKLWRTVSERVADREMPPEKEPPLAEPERALLLRWLKTASVVDCRDPANRDPGPALVRRMNRTEYNRTIHDLFGIDFDAGEAVGLSEDRVGKGFDTLAAGLFLPPTMMEKYFAAADKILEGIFVSPEEFAKLDKAKQQKIQRVKKRLLIAKPSPELPARDLAQQVIAHFAQLAFRRPVEKSEVERLLKFYDRAAGKGESFDDAVRAMLKPVLVSPNFLFRTERDRPTVAVNAVYPINDYELATRLSYFLWSTMPDEELFTLAEQGTLSKPEILAQQVKRMLDDAKARALTDGFATQWLQIGRVASARPSTEFFPTFTDKVRRAMRDETLTFFNNLREEDRSVLDLLDADYTFLNEDLAKHYGMAGSAGVTGAKLQRVTLKPEDHRGGLLGMGSVLAMNSHTYRTSPTLRGKYILEVVFGTPPPPPPPLANAGVLKEEKEGKTDVKTFRELLARHVGDPACASCHAKMDPLGFALENYDAVGRWRESTPERPLDTAGQLPNGEKLNGTQELKKIILKRQDDFIRNLTEQMLSYALGRELLDGDECAVNEIVIALKRDQNHFSTLVQSLVKSYAFQSRRNAVVSKPEGAVVK